MVATLDMRGDIAIIQLDDGKANAVNHAFLDAVNACLDEAEQKAKALVLVGRPGRFSAGFDLKYFQSSTPEESAGLVRRGGELALRLFRFPMPVIGACTGHGIAMGAFMLLSCDFRIGVEGEFKIGANETAISMILPHFAFELTKARVAKTELSRAVIEGHLYDPHGAVKAGFLDEVVPADALLDRVMARAEQLAALPTKAYTGNKLGVRKESIAAIEAGLSTVVNPAT